MWGISERCILRLQFERLEIREYVLYYVIMVESTLYSSVDNI